ncbi:MAG: AMP-binding protein [Microthrixaceae bacterium]
MSDIVRRNANYFGDSEALVVPGSRVSTWSEVDERTNRLARALLELGLSKGDRLAAYMPNVPEYVEFFFACAKSGIIGSATNIRLTGGDLTSYLNLVEPSAILVHSSLTEGAGWVQDVPSISHVIGVGAGHGLDLDYDTLLAAQPGTDPGCDIDEQDIYQFGATSGTTGIPKAAMMTHRNAIAAITCWMAEMPYPERSTNLQNVPLFFNPGGPSGLNPVMMKGGRIVIFPAFEPGSFLHAIEDHGVTHAVLVPTMLGMVLNHPDVDKVDTSSLLAVNTGGSPVPGELLASARERFGDIFYPLYGMAETYSCGAILRREDQYTEGTQEQVDRLLSVGLPMVLSQMRVVDADGKDVPKDSETAGEIWVGGDTVCKGYWRMPEETAEVREGEWMKTGDVAVVDREGFATIVDRTKDIIISGGINVYSREVEEAFYDHPAVLQAAVIGIPHEKWGEAIHAVVVLKEGGEATVEELQAFATERLADFKKPRSVEVVEALPIGGTGKILKKDLRAPYWEGQERAL